MFLFDRTLLSTVCVTFGVVVVVVLIVVIIVLFMIQNSCSTALLSIVLAWLGRDHRVQLW